MVGEPARCDVLNFQGSKGNNCVTDDGSCPNLNAMHGHDVHVVAQEGEGCLNPNDSLSKRIFGEHGAFHSVCAGSRGGRVCIALDGDKLKPREDQRKGGNGFGVNEEGAGYTLTGVDRHGVAYKAKRTWWNGSDVATTTTTTGHNQLMPDIGRFYAVVECYENYAHDSRVQGPIDTAPTQGSSNANSAGVSGNNPLVCFPKVSHPKAKDGDGERWDEREVAQTRNTFDNGEKRCQEVVVSANGVSFDGRKDAPIAEGVAHSQTIGTNPGFKDGVVIGLSQMRYIVRRLTPTEAERLMGLPSGYTIPRGLRITDELVAEFQRIFDTFGAIMAEYEHKPAPKPKSANQVRAWLEKITDPDTCPDSPRYKACGNGWATNQPRWILTRLLAIGEGIDPFTGEEL